MASSDPHHSDTPTFKGNALRLEINSPREYRRALRNENHPKALPNLRIQKCPDIIIVKKKETSKTVCATSEEKS